MITGGHVVIFSADAEADRAFIRDILGWPHVDVGAGWLIFRLPPSEVAVHPADRPSCDLYLMCDDLEATMATLSEAEVPLGEISEQRWGRQTALRLPGGGALGLYEPRHPIAAEL